MEMVREICSRPQDQTILTCCDRVFIIDGIITIVVAAYGVIFFPDTPYTTKAFYLSAEDKARCIERLAEDGREETSNFTWDLFLRSVKSWQLYVLTILWM